ncbi:aminodeoxychorismate synthase, component I [Rhodospirillaceae bacterium SYSU D60014]|uniref:aminodeoxychorismate synthase, component I n=1 Tax=Virgifigura deserti TaxID=2268457 RepID=UPI000E667DFF
MAATLLVHEIPYRDPLDLFARFARLPGTVFLDSALPDGPTGRYSFIAADPFRTLRSRDGRITDGAATANGDPFAALQRLLAEYPVEPRPELPPFQTGVAGYFGYDLAQHLERVPPHGHDDQGFPDLLLGAYDVTVALDHDRRRAWILSSGYPETTADGRAQRAETRLDWCRSILAGPPHAPPRATLGPGAAEMTCEDYLTMIRRTIDYIYAGDIYQANLTQRFRTELPPDADPFALYCALRRRNPAPFAAYLGFGEVVIASASPERFLQLRDGRVETRPIKGTRPRGRTPDEDRALAAELSESAKDRAENLMIVDLLRNDLSRVCRDHSVQVPALFALESYATVHHLVSVVTGELRDGMGPVDLLRATFPGGSITGAPKIRAMEIIAELEPTRRGPYCGSIGYIGFDGSMDTSITIRTYSIKDRVVTFQVGGGIVADSDPVAEYDESLTKARALQEALGAGEAS